MHRVLNILRHVRDERGKLVLVERVRNGAAVLALTNICRLLQPRLDLRLTLAATHIGNRHEGPGLRPSTQRAMGRICLHRVVPEHGVHLDRRRRPSVSRGRRNGRLLVGDAVGIGLCRNQIRYLIRAGPRSLLILDSLVAGIIVDPRELLNLK